MSNGVLGEIVAILFWAHNGISEAMKMKTKGYLFWCLPVVWMLYVPDSYAKSCDCEGESGTFWTYVKNRTLRTGGCIGPQVTVSNTALIAKSAKVCGKAQIKGDARIFGSCVVTDNSIVDSASCYGDARIDGDARVLGQYSRVFEQAHITGTAVLTGQVTVKGHQKLKSGHYENGTLDGQLVQSR